MRFVIIKDDLGYETKLDTPKALIDDLLFETLGGTIYCHEYGASFFLAYENSCNSIVKFSFKRTPSLKTIEEFYRKAFAPFLGNKGYPTEKLTLIKAIKDEEGYHISLVLFFRKNPRCSYKQVYNCLMKHKELGEDIWFGIGYD